MSALPRPRPGDPVVDCKLDADADQEFVAKWRHRYVRTDPDGRVILRFYASELRKAVD